MSFKNIKSEDVERTFYTERVDQALEKKYRDGFDSANQDEQNEETYPLGRFRRDVILCLLIQGRLISYSVFTQFMTSRRHHFFHINNVILYDSYISLIIIT